MKRFKQIFLFCAFISLIGVRFIKSFPWVSSLAVAGVFISLFDIINHIWNDNPYERIKRKKIYFFCFVFGIIIEILLIILIIFNIALSLPWMENDLFIDVVTIITLMLGVYQSSIVSNLNILIQGKEKLTI